MRGKIAFRKNSWIERSMIILMSLALVFGMAPWLGIFTANAETGVSEEYGAFTVTAENQESLDAVTYGENILTFSSVAAGRTYVIRQTAGVNNATADRIVVQSGATTPVSITLEGVNINTASGPAMDIQGNSAVNLILADETVNTLITGCERVAGIQVQTSGASVSSIKISGNGEINVTGGGCGAGIGCGQWSFGGNVTISGGVVNVTGGYAGAGIGCGMATHGSSGGNIIIEGGIVTATAGDESAGIGGGSGGAGGNITIRGGTVNATGATYASGIGGGQYGAMGNITISGGVVNSGAGNGSAGIGSGTRADSGVIDISGGIINAKGGNFGAGIGGASGAPGAKLTISGGTVTACGGESGAGIGGGCDGNGETITISGGTVIATGGELASAIGGGESIVFGGEGATLKINREATVIAANDGYKPALDATTPITATEGKTVANILKTDFASALTNGSLVEVKNYQFKSLSESLKYKTESDIVKSVAFTSPAISKGSKYTLSVIATGGTERQQQNGTDGKATVDFAVSDGMANDSGVYEFTNVKDAPAAEPEPAKPVAPTPRHNLRVKAGATKVVLSWNKVKGADGYYIYGNKCGPNSVKKIKTIKKSDTLTWTQKNLKKGKTYKYKIQAYKKTAKGTKILKTSVMVHEALSGSKYTNAKKVTANFTTATLKKGKTKQIKAKIIKQNPKKKLVSHVDKFRYRTNNSKVATVSKSGKIKAVGKGKCYIYIYANNGVNKKLTITVK